MIVSSFLALFVLLLAAIVSGSISAFVFACLFYAIGILFCQTVPSFARVGARKVFNVVFSSALLFAIFHYMDTVVDWNNFAQDWKDEYKFWTLSNYLADYSSLEQLAKDCFVYRVHIENEGYIFYIGMLAYMAEHFFDGNHLLLQFLGSVISGSLMAIVFYKICLLFFDAKRSVIYALLYSLCTVVFYYSFTLVRDIHIAFFYILSFYIIFKRFSIKGFVLLLLNVLIVWHLRFEHGLFLFVFVAYYVYERVKRNVVLVGVLALLGGSVFIAYFLEDFIYAQESMAHYMEFTSDAVFGVEDSLGAVFYTFPSPIKEIMILLNSFLQPFPSWTALSNATNVFSGIVAFVDIVRGIFWFVVFVSLLVWLFVDKLYKNIPKKFVYLLLIILGFLILNTSNMNVRRVMCVYPIIFLVYVWIQNKYISQSKCFRVTCRIVSFYVCLIFVYVVIKYLT